MNPKLRAMSRKNAMVIRPIRRKDWQCQNPQRLDAQLPQGMKIKSEPCSDARRSAEMTDPSMPTESNKIGSRAVVGCPRRRVRHEQIRTCRRLVIGVNKLPYVAGNPLEPSVLMISDNRIGLGNQQADEVFVSTTARVAPALAGWWYSLTRSESYGGRQNQK